MLIWLFLVGTVAMSYNAFMLGANDVSNSFATSVGSGVLSIKQTKYIAGFFEFTGAFLMGSRVSKTIRKGIVELGVFKGHPGALMLGMVCANISAGIWLHIATYLKLPVSTTHSIVGSIIGFSLVFKGYDAVNWGWFEFKGFSKIIISWFISPIIAGAFAYLLYNILNLTVIKSSDPYKNVLRIFPILTSFTVLLGMMFIIYKGSPQLELDDMDLGTSFAISVPCSILVGALTWFVYIPYKKRKMDENIILHAEQEIQAVEIPDILVVPGHAEIPVVEENIIDLDGAESPEDQIKVLQKEINERKSSIRKEKLDLLHSHAKPISIEVETLCSSLQVITACFSSFAHGANDVSNSIAPYATVYAMYQDLPVDKKNDVPIWILFLGGFWIVVGLATWGYKVIERIGEEMTKVTPSRGFLIEYSAALTTLIASRLELPVSTTHCQIGAVIGCGLGDNNLKSIQWKLVKHIFLSWLVTVPAAALISAGIFHWGITQY